MPDNRPDAEMVLDLMRAGPASNTRVNTLPVMRPPPEGIERYAREGVELDTTTGVPFGKRAGLSFAETPEQRIGYMQQAYAGSRVDRTGDGQLIVRNVQDPATGKVKDLLVDEKDLTLKDLADMTAAGLKMGAEIGALYSSGLATAPSFLARIGGGALAGAAVGEAVGSAGQSVLGIPQTLGEHLQSFGQNALLGAATAGVVEGGVGSINTMRGKLVGEFAPRAEERVGLDALSALERDTGITITPSIGQVSHDPNVLNLEGYLGNLPFYGKRFQEQQEAREAGVRQLKAQQVGEAPLQPLADLGADLAQTIKSRVEQPGMAMAQAEQSLVTRAADQLESAVQRLSPSARSFTEEGTSALTKFSARNDIARFRSVANDLFEEAGNPEISTAPLKPMLEKIKEGLPKKTVVTESDLIDLTGKPLATTEGKAIVRELVPTELQRFLNGLESLDASMPLDQIRRIRNTVDDAIREGRGLEGVSTYELKQLQHALTETINKGAEMLGAEGKALLRANSFYRENIERFEVPFIARMLKETPDAPGYIGNFELMQTIRSNPDNYRQLEQFLKGSLTEGGKPIAASSAKVMNVVNRSLMEDVLSRARASAGPGELINAKAFASDLASFKPEIQSAILGAESDVVKRNLDLLKTIKEGYESIPQSELERFLRFPANSVEDLGKLLKAAKEQKALFENEVIKPFLSGKSVDPSRLNSEQALDWMLTAKNNADVAQVMAMASDNPEVVESIRRNTAARVFQEVSQKVKPADASRLNEIGQLVDPAKLIARFKDPEGRTRLRTLLGDESFNVLENFAKSQTVLGKIPTGSLVGRSTATRIMTNALRFFKDVPHAAKFMIYATALTNKDLQRAVMEASLSGAEPRRFAAALISSTPVLQALGQEYGKSGAELIIDSVSKALGGVRNEEGLKMKGQRQELPAPSARPDADQLLQLMR